jgi:hypothetical protein
MSAQPPFARRELITRLDVKIRVPSSSRHADALSRDQRERFNLDIHTRLLSVTNPHFSAYDTRFPRRSRTLLHWRRIGE